MTLQPYILTELNRKSDLISKTAPAHLDLILISKTFFGGILQCRLVQLYNRTLSKIFVLKIKFDDRTVMLIYTIAIVTGIGSLTCCKEATPMT